MDQAHLLEICKTLRIGVPLIPPSRVYGGLLHIMWKVITDTGSYAIKQLSEDIDLRNEKVRNNYELTENIAHRFSEKDIAAVSALRSNGQTLMCFDGIGFLVYPWIDSHNIYQSEASYLKIASILAKLHLIDLQVPEISEPMFDIHTNDNIIGLIINAESQSAIFTNSLRTSEDEILAANELYKNPIPILKERLVISHGDLDQKNVLWVKGQPILIDWESARKLNPTYEIINASLDWCGITTNIFNKKLFIKMIQTYISTGGRLDKKHVTAALHGVLGNWINWLIYNIKRVCITEDTEQKALGIAQINLVLLTILRLHKSQDAIYEMILPFTSV